MNKQTRLYVEEQIKALLQVPFACPEAKKAGEAWLKAENGPHEKEASIALIQELKEDIEPIENLLAFAKSPIAAKEFGEQKAKAFLAHAEELQKQGATHCDCPACHAASCIVAQEKELLA